MIKFPRFHTRGGIIILVVLLLGGTLAWADSSSIETESTSITGFQYPNLPIPRYTEQGTISQSGGLSTPQLIEAALKNGEIDQDTANLYLAYAIGDHEKLPSRFVSNVPWDGTLPLLSLQGAVQTMGDSPTRKEIEKVLTGYCSGSSGFMYLVVNTDHFHIEFNTIVGGLVYTDYTTSLEAAWDAEVTDFGWAAPPVYIFNPPPGNRYHVRIDDLGSGLYGFVSTNGDHAGYMGENPNTTWFDIDAYATCMVLNQDYSGFPGTAQQALDATTAHEFNHSIQYGIGAITGSNSPDINFIEGGATWMEDEVFDASNDNWIFLWPNFSMCMGEYTDSPYSYWITFRGLTERFGTSTSGGAEQVMQDFWELTSQSSTSNMLSAMNSALVNQGTTLADAYHAYAIAAKFNKTCSGGYVYPYCLEEGPGYVGASGATSVHADLSSGGTFDGRIYDNYALNWISLPSSGGLYKVTLENTSSAAQLQASVVCDTGTELRIDPMPTVITPGQTRIIRNYDPTGCSSVVGVVTNQLQTSENPSSCTRHSYKLKTIPVTIHTVSMPVILNNYSAPPTGFDSQFNGDSSGWVSHSGGWYNNGYHYFSGGIAGSTASASYPENFSNFDYSAKLWRIGSDSVANRIYVRGTPDPLDGYNDWYSYYMLQYTREGKFSVFKRVNGGTPIALQGWMSSAAVNQGDAWNTLRVVATGSSLSFYINGTLVWSGSDSSLSTGRVGIGMYRYPSSSGDWFYVDWATLNILSGGGMDRVSTVGEVSPEQQILNQAANQTPVVDVNSSE